MKDKADSADIGLNARLGARELQSLRNNGHDDAAAEIERLRALLHRAAGQLSKWHITYGFHNPDWLPPHGDINLMEDIAAELPPNAKLTRGPAADEEPKDKTLAQTFVWHGEDAFMVSTVDRRSSAALAYDRVYAQTLVWEWFPKTEQRGQLIGQDEASAGSLHAHQGMVERLFKTGLCEEPEHDC